jgi:hypothetical protein
MGKKEKIVMHEIYNTKWDGKKLYQHSETLKYRYDKPTGFRKVKGITINRKPVYVKVKRRRR